ncbi:hypothetical protein O3P69_002773 [Scylla paramamosain]|uniref:Uncharacterized protein n=1 Tax=Scylla paramamosain TaxID=85552 RepID=A0AAW0UM92_SCYPA
MSHPAPWRLLCPALPRRVRLASRWLWRKPDRLDAAKSNTATWRQLAVARRPHHVPVPCLADGPVQSLVAVGMKALDLLVLPCGRKAAEYRNQLRDGLDRLLPGHSSPAITDGRSVISAAQSSRSVSHARVPLGGSETYLQAAGRRRAGCGRLYCPACRQARLARLGDSRDRTPGDAGHRNPRETKNTEDGNTRPGKPSCNCALQFADRSASLDTWLERTARAAVSNPELQCNKKVLPVHQESGEAPPCRCVEAEHKRQLLRRSKSLPYPGGQEGRAGNADERRDLIGDDVAGTHSLLETMGNQNMVSQGAVGVPSPLTHPRRPCRHAMQAAVHAPHHPGSGRQFMSYYSASHPIRSSPRGGCPDSTHPKQYHAVAHPPMPLACQARVPGVHHSTSSDCHLFGLSGSHSLLPPVTSADAQRHHVDQEMATRFHLGRSATVDVLEENFGSREMAVGEPSGGCRCLMGPRSPQESRRPEANWRPRVKSISDPNIPLNVADGGPAAEESNKSVGRAGAARSPPPTRTKRTEIYMELRPPRESVVGQSGADFSEEEQSNSFDSSKTASSSGRQTPLGYAADAQLTPHSQASTTASSRSSSQYSLSSPEMADAATQTPVAGSYSPPPVTTFHASSMSLSEHAVPRNRLEAQEVTRRYLEGAGDRSARIGAGQTTAEESDLQQGHPQPHLQLCTCRKVRRVAVPSPHPRTSWRAPLLGSSATPPPPPAPSIPSPGRWEDEGGRRERGKEEGWGRLFRVIRLGWAGLHWTDLDQHNESWTWLPCCIGLDRAGLLETLAGWLAGFPGF